MPEGPLVSIMVDKISKFEKDSLKKVQINSGRYKRHSLPKNFNTFNKSLPSKIKTIKNKGKFVYIVLENNWSIWITLGMTGHFVLKPLKHTHYCFVTSKGTFYIDDMRNFGTLSFYKLTDVKCPLLKKLESLGPDPIRSDIKYKDFLKRFDIFKNKRPKEAIGELLMNQGFYSGIGNYLRSDILYDANICPLKELNKLTKTELNRLFKSMVKIMRLNYKNRKKGRGKFLIYKKKYTAKKEKVKTYTIKGRTVYTIL